MGIRSWRGSYDLGALYVMSLSVLGSPGLSLHVCVNILAYIRKTKPYGSFLASPNIFLVSPVLSPVGVLELVEADVCFMEVRTTAPTSGSLGWHARNYNMPTL